VRVAERKRGEEAGEVGEEQCLPRGFLFLSFSSLFLSSFVCTCPLGALDKALSLLLPLPALWPTACLLETEEATRLSVTSHPHVTITTST
jgi:hypothetical protein